MVRSLAFSVLISSSSSTKPLSAGVLDILRSRLGALHADTDAKFRNEILSQTRHMIERIRGATAHLVKELQNISFSTGPDQLVSKLETQGSATEINKLLETHKDFVKWYLEFLLGELIPTSSYQRHITALRALALLLKSGLSQRHISLQSAGTVWVYSINIFTSGCMRLLLDLLMDPFEDVRVNALALLRLASRDDFSLGHQTSYLEDIIPIYTLKDFNVPMPASEHNYGLTNSVPAIKTKPLSALTEFITRASEISKRTGRADYADGVARCYELFYFLLPSTTSRLDLIQDLVDELTIKISIAETELSKAVADAPVHGLFSALR